MDNGTGITPVMPVGGMGDGFGGNSFMWIFGLLILLGLFNGGGFGFGNNGFANAIGYENLATSNEVQRGFDNQNAMANQRDILAAVNAQGAAGIAATNQSFHDSLAAMQSLYNETARDIADLRVGQANALANQNTCCCETKQLIMQSDYNAAMRDAATNAKFTSEIQGIKDMIYQNKIETLQNQVNMLTTQGIVDRATAGIVRYPSSTTYAVPSPCFNAGCGCGNI